MSFQQFVNENDDTMDECSRICVECQRCCKEVHVQTGYPLSDGLSTEFYKARGFIVEDKSGKIYLRMNVPCPHLDKKGCAIYESRPQVCRAYMGESLGDLCPLNKLRESLPSNHQNFPSSEKTKDYRECPGCHHMAHKTMKICPNCNTRMDKDKYERLV